MVLAGIGGGVVSRYDRRPKQLFIRCYWNSIGTINRKAPAFLQGLLQFDLRLERRWLSNPLPSPFEGEGTGPNLLAAEQFSYCADDVAGLRYESVLKALVVWHRRMWRRYALDRGVEVVERLVSDNRGKF